MKNFLRVAALAICAILMTANASAQDNYNATTMGEKVYLETANWGQNSPFNKQIFTSYGGSTNAKAGCVPTAYAIVMRYHGFPEEGTAKTLYNCQAPTYVEITDRVYDFSKMPLTNGSGWTEEQQTEVAKFFSHVLHACFPSKIGTGSTEVNEGQTSKVLNDYFNYQLINASYQANFTMEQWAEKLRESISNGCPVPYAANNSGTGDTRHMFVVDGYTTGGYFHFNFGWSGSGNGWFKLDNITPSQGDDYSWNGNSQHYALFNLAPNKTPRTVTATANPSSMGTVSINGGTAGSSVSAEVIEGTKATLTAHHADGYALANWTKNGVIIGTKNPIQVTVGESGNDYVANFDEASNVQIEKTCTFKISDVTTSGISGSYCSTWTTGDGIVLSCTKDSEPAYALSTSVNTFFAKAAVGNSETLVSGITYTLTAPEGYVIKSYSFKGKSPSGSYTIDVTVGGNTTNVTNASAGVIISASDINSQSTSFVLGSTYAGRAGLAILEDGVTVTIQSEGGASTPTPEPTPVTYSVAVTAGNGGTATASAATIEQGKDVTLTATPDTGYEFTGWYNGTTMVSDANPYTFAVTGNINFVANFEAVEQGGDETTDPLAGKWFRLKENNNGRYMNVKNHTAHAQKVTAGGVNVAARVEDSNAQIFFFEKSGDGYMLKDGDDYYINCLEWSVDASSTTGGSTLLFEETGTEGIYYIKWYNTYKGGEKYFKVGPDSNGSGDHPYCDADNKTLTWTLEETVRKEVTPLPFKVEIEGWWENNPNTHLGTITVGGTAMKLTPAHRTASDIKAAEGAALAFTRKYRGYEFNGFHIGTTSLGENPTLTAENIAAINATTPLVAKFTATDDVTLFYDDDQYSYRIPAIARTGNNTLVAVSDYRHNLDDIGRDNHGTGTKRIDLVMRTSNDNGATWSATRTIAAGDNSKTGSYLRAFGDAAIAAYGNNILVMAAAGDVLYTAGTTSNPNRMARIYSTDNGENWTIEEMTTKMYSQSTSLIPSAGSAFFGSGKLAVDENFNNTGNARIYGALLVRIGSNNYNNFAVFSDDLGATWKILGGDNTNPIASGDEPKIEILPNGQILLSARRGGGRVFRVFTYGDDKANGAGSWGNAAVNGCDNGGSNATNGEIICLNAKKIDGTAVKLLLQSQPQGGSNQYDRNNVTIWYKEVSAAETYTSATIASDWTQGKQVSTVKSAYSAMCLQENGKIAFFFEEAPCYGDDHTKGYSMVYVPLTVEEITGYSYYSVDTELPETATIKAVLTDANGNEYHETVETSFSTEAVAAALTAKYPYITLGTNGTLASNNNGTYTYTNTVELPFAVSNNSTTVWHNIYWPANTNENGYPVYLSASGATDTYVPKVTESKVYGNSSYNTLNTNDNISWAIYNVGNGFAFTFKNKVTGKYIQATGVANGNAQNVVYADETDATAFTLLKETNSYRGEYSLVAGINGTTGYLCSTSATSYHYATLYSGKSHQGAWIKFEKVDYEGIIAQINGALATVGANIGQYTLAGEKVADYNNIKSSMTNSGEVKLNTLKEYLTDIETLFTGATLNSPTTGRYYRIAYDYGTTAGKLYMQGVATEQYKNNQNSYAAKFDKGTGAESIWYYDGGLLSYTAGKYIKENGNDRGLQAVGTKQNATFSTSSRDAGKFCINLGSYLHANVTGSNYYSDHCSGNNCSQHDFIIEDVPSLPVEITGAGYATLYAPVALEIPAGVTAYTVAIDGEWAILSEIEGGIIPAGTGVVIYSETADTYNFTITTTEDSATSALSGTVSAAYIEEDAYVLTLDSELGVCFGTALKNQQNNTAWLNNSHKAYLPKQMGSNAASYSFRFDNGTTVIEEVKAESGKVKAIYDLQGRKVDTPSKGIYIINGKKVMIK